MHSVYVGLEQIDFFLDDVEQNENNCGMRSCFGTVLVLLPSVSVSGRRPAGHSAVICDPRDHVPETSAGSLKQFRPFVLFRVLTETYNTTCLHDRSYKLL